MVTCRVTSPFPLMPVLGKVEGWDFLQTMGRPKGIFRRFPFVKLLADSPNGTTRRQAFEQNNLYR